jgi:hypothetical protein
MVYIRDYWGCWTQEPLLLRRSTGFLTVLTDPHNAPVAVLAEENGTILTSENHKLKPSDKMEILVWRALVWAHGELRGSRDDSPSIRSAPDLDTAFP